MSWQKLDELCRKLEALGHAESILDADEAIFMPQGGGEKRAEAMAVLAGMHHEAATAPEVGDWIAAAEAEIDSEAQRLALGEFKRVYRNMTCLPTDFVRRQSELRTKSMQVWREARPKGDWDGFRPMLEDIVKMAREEAVLRSEALGLAPYDALMEQFDPGNRVADIDPIFAAFARIPRRLSCPRRSKARQNVLPAGRFGRSRDLSPSIASGRSASTWPKRSASISTTEGSMSRTIRSPAACRRMCA